VPGELADGERGEQAGDERHQHGERQCAAREAGAGRDGRRDGRTGGHRGDALEQNLAQSDGPVPQTARRLPGGYRLAHAHLSGRLPAGGPAES